MAWLAGLCLRQRWEVSTGMEAVDGLLISLRASSVRQAQQALSRTMMLMLFVPIFGVQALPDAWRERIYRNLLVINLSQVLLGAVPILAGLNIQFLALAMARFQQANPIQD